MKVLANALIFATAFFTFTALAFPSLPSLVSPAEGSSLLARDKASPPNKPPPPDLQRLGALPTCQVCEKDNCKVDLTKTAGLPWVSSMSTAPKDRYFGIDPSKSSKGRTVHL